MLDVRLIIFAVLVTACLPAFAYIDPGLGQRHHVIDHRFFCGAGINGQNVLVQTESAVHQADPVRRQSRP